MRLGLTTRLLLPMGIVVIVSVAAIALYTGRLATAEFARLEVVADVQVLPGAEPAFEEEDVQRLIALGFSKDQGWTEPGPLMEQLQSLTPGYDALLFDSEGALIAASADLGNASVRQTAAGDAHIERTTDRGVDLQVIRGREIDVTLPGAGHVGNLILYPNAVDDTDKVIRGNLGRKFGDEDRILGPGDGGDLGGNERSRASAFRGSLYRGMLLGVLAVGLLALGITAVLVRRTLQPIGALTLAAQRMAKGDLGQRVPITSNDEVGDLSTAFNTMANALERIESLRRDMVGDVAHELRTPLTNVRCQLETIQDGLREPEPELIDSLHEEISILGQLVDDLQELTLASAGQLKLDTEPLDLRKEIERAVARSSQALGSDGPAVETLFSGDLEVHADPRRLQQILRNLLNNALSHTPPSGRIEIEARGDQAGIEVLVRDTGPGIAPEHLDKVFERFYRADASRSRGSGGAGLGLAIVRQLVELHGGDIRAESPPGKGAVFRFRIPRASS